MNQQKSTPKRSRTIWGAALLLACLLALVLGVFGAVYFAQNQPGTPNIVSNQLAPTAPTAGPVSPAPVTAPPSVAQAPQNNQTTQSARPPESALPQSAQAPAAPVPPPAQAQTAPSAAPAAAIAQGLAQIAPSAAPANVAAAAPRYWVEFGAYDGAFYADRLKRSLDKLGIAATVTEAPGKHGKRYLRVRGADQGDRNAALAQLSKAQRALHIAPLLHRVAAAAPAAARVANRPPSGAHWVQFGAFRARGSAASMVAKLRKNNVQASVLETKISGKKALYLVRAAGLPDRAAATRVAQQGAAALHSHDVLIGESLRARPPPR